MDITTIPDNNTDFNRVVLRMIVTLGRTYPICKIHGAMLKVSSHEGGGGYWRCGGFGCRAGCIEIDNN